MQNQTGLTVHYTAKQRPKEEKRQISPNTQTTRKQTILLSALRPLASTLSSGFAIWHARILTPQRFAVTAEWNCLPGNNCTIGLQFLCVVWTHLTPRKRQSRKEKQLSSDCTTVRHIHTSCLVCHTTKLKYIFFKNPLWFNHQVTLGEMAKYAGV